MLVNMKYGKTELSFEIGRDRVVKILEPNERSGLENALEGVQDALKNPIGTPPLGELVRQKKPRDVVIIVNDITRPTPYECLLPPLLGCLSENGISKDQITFLTATGIHDPHTPEQNIEVYGKELVDDYRFMSHCSDDA